jgi:hypothetical protein
LNRVRDGQADLEKQFEGLKLEVNCLNHFMERENMVNPQWKPGFFTTIESPSGNLVHGVEAAGPEGHRVASHS